MENALKFYINGEWVEPSTSDTIDVINPATEEPIAKVAMGGKEDVDRAVAAAKAAFETFSQTSVEERADLLERIIKSFYDTVGKVTRGSAAKAIMSTLMTDISDIEKKAVDFLYGVQYDWFIYKPIEISA